MTKILQICPAPAKLRAMFLNEDGESANLERITCLALMKDSDGDRYICPMIAGETGEISPAEQCASFVGFTYDRK